MVRFLHNVTSLAGVSTLCKILDFKNQTVNLSENLGISGNAVISFPQTPGAPNQNVSLYTEFSSDAVAEYSKRTVVHCASGDGGYVHDPERRPDHILCVVRRGGWRNPPALGRRHLHYSHRLQDVLCRQRRSEVRFLNLPPPTSNLPTQLDRHREWLRLDIVGQCGPSDLERPYHPGPFDPR
jgi:hypothetical protein